MRKVLLFLNEALASCFFLTYPIAAFAHQKGYRLTGAGLVGSLAGLLTVPFLPMKAAACATALLGALFMSVAVSDAAEESLGHKDDPRIVIDEWVGYLISVAVLPRTWVVLGAGLVLFRVLDTCKPLGIRELARLPGGWGVVMDDVAAGLVVNAILHCLPLS